MIPSGVELRYACSFGQTNLNHGGHNNDPVSRNSKADKLRLQSKEHCRKLYKGMILELSVCNYLRNKRNVIVMGASGAGKTFIGCALGNAACKNLMSTKYIELCFEVWHWRSSMLIL